MGKCYSEGWAGIEKDEKEAVKWFELACTDDRIKEQMDYSTEALYSLGLCYANGCGVVQDAN